MAFTVDNNGLLIFLDRGTNAASTRTPITKFLIGASQTTPEVTDTDLDSKVQFDGSVGYYKNFESKYPAVDTSKLEVNFKGIVADTQGNGSDLNGVGLANTDGTPLLAAHGTHTAVTKTTSKRIIHLIKIKARTSFEL